MKEEKILLTETGGEDKGKANYSGLFYCPTFPLPLIVEALTKRLFQAC